MPDSTLFDPASQETPDPFFDAPLNSREQVLSALCEVMARALAPFASENSEHVTALDWWRAREVIAVWNKWADKQAQRTDAHGGGE
jgi:hypothetical protein